MQGAATELTPKMGCKNIFMSCCKTQEGKLVCQVTEQSIIKCQPRPSTKVFANTSVIRCNTYETATLLYFCDPSVCVTTEGTKKMLACVSMIVVSILEIPNLHGLVAVQSEKQQHLDVDSIICDKFLTFFFVLFYLVVN